MRTPNDIRLAEKVPEVKTNIKTHPCGLLELLQETLFKNDCFRWTSYWEDTIMFTRKERYEWRLYCVSHFPCWNEKRSPSSCCSTTSSSSTTSCFSSHLSQVNGTHILKSGTDFRQFSLVTLDFREVIISYRLQFCFFFRAVPVFNFNVELLLFLDKTSSTVAWL